MGADERDLIKSFEKEKSIRENLIEKDSATKNRSDKFEKISLSKFYITPKTISVILILLSFLGLFYYLYKKMDTFVATPELIVLSPESDDITESSQVVVRGKTDRGNEVFVNDRPVMVDEDGFFSEKITLKNGVNIINIKSVNRFKKETIKTVSVEARYAQKEDEKNFKQAENNENSSNENTENNQSDERKNDAESKK
ncbi:MAG TPA: hypothetical protein ENJ53_09950 [Phaeodactylibacter sp.]|nr:hypothetical protein [Phaeodactylibacter sp.]